MKKIFTILLLIVVFLLLLGRIILNPVATKITRDQMRKALNVPADLEKISISILAGKVELRGLTIGQPEGFGDDNALSLGRYSMDIAMTSLLKGDIRVESIEVDSPQVHIVNDPEKGMNMALLAKAEEETKEETEKPSKTLTALLESLQVRDGIIRFTDHTKGPSAIDVVVTNLNVGVSSILIGDVAKNASHEGAANITLDIVQKAGTNATAWVAARIGTVPLDGIPALAASVRVAGFELETAGPLPGKDIIGFLGGYGLDLKVDAQVTPEHLAVKGVIVNEYGQEHNLIAVKGTVEKPEVEMATAISGALNMPVAALTATAGNVVDAGGKAATAVLDTGAAAVSGAASAIGSVFGGLTSAGGKLLEGDISGAGGALVDGVENTASAAVGTVTGTAGALADGVVNTAGTAIGSDQLPKWRSTLPDRSKELFEAAQKELAEQTFPPVANK